MDCDVISPTKQHSLGALSLTLKTSPGQGTIVHLGKSKRDQKKLNDDPSFIPISESGSTKSYFYLVRSFLPFC